MYQKVSFFSLPCIFMTSLKPIGCWIESKWIKLWITFLVKLNQKPVNFNSDVFGINNNTE